MSVETPPLIPEHEILVLVFREESLQDLRRSQAEQDNTVEVLPRITMEDKKASAARYAQMAAYVFGKGLARPLKPKMQDSLLWRATALQAMRQGGAVVRIAVMSEEDLLWDPSQASKK